MKMLEVNNLKKTFGKNEVLKGVSLSLEQGEALSILGQSGGGKTTFLRCLNFLEKADEGDIIVNGKNVFHAEIGKKPIIAPNAQLSFGLVFQQFNLFPQYNIMRNLTLAPELLGRGTKEEREEKAMALIHRIGLSDRADFYPCQLSGGQQQRVAIARALMLEPDILCFDEPTSALDPSLTGEVVNVIKELKSNHTTMLIVTHEMNFARQVADRVILMANGQIAEDAPTEEFFTNPKSQITRDFLQYSE